MLRHAFFLSTVLALPGLLSGGPAAAEAKRRPVLLISIDGLKPDAVLEADKHGLAIPALRDVLANGSHAREVVNVSPTVTNPNHTTLVTGVLPSEHGIYNNRPFEPSEKGGKSYGLYSQIKAPTLWGVAKAAGLKTASLFWPVTDEAKDIDLNPRDGSDEDDGKIARDAIALIETECPDLLTIHFVSLDHEEHKSGPFSPEANAILERIDTAIGAVVAAERKVRPDAVVAIVSDHGFYEVTRQVNLNTALVEAGLITLGSDRAVMSWKALGWYVGGSAMIVLKDAEDQQTRAAVKIFLDRLAQNPSSGIERIYAREEVADLGFAAQAEFVVAFKTGYRMGMALTGPLAIDAKGGAHGAFSTRTVRPDMHSAFFIAGPGIAAGKDLGVIDMRRIAPTLSELLQIPLPSARMPSLPVRQVP
jgi:predicted AlkP superfamily pyrophosphatase or phosphodiesterase